MRKLIVVFYSIFFMSAFFLLPGQVIAYPSFWDDSAYAIECNEDSGLREVLEDFSESFGVLLKMERDVGGSCEGWIRGGSAATFLDSLSYKYQFQWYVFKKTLYISSIKTLTTTRLEVDPNLKVALRDLGLYEEKFGWGDINEKDVALISGPKSYIRHIKRLLDKPKKKKDDSKKDGIFEVYVIPVKYSSVTERVIHVREEKITIPSITEILSATLKDISGQKKPAAEEGGTGSGSGEVIKKSEELFDNISDAPKKIQILVQADVRTNSLIIRSSNPKYNKEYFEDLIAKIDTPQNMIEIDAIIVDIDKEKLKQLGVTNLEKASATQLSGIQLLADSTSNSTLFVRDPVGFTAELRALESIGEASIVANTSVLTMENQSAVIDLSETFFIQSIGERVANTQPYTTGTLLNVTPHMITAEDSTKKIKLTVEIEDGQFIEQGGSEILPMISKSNITTSAVVDRNQALVIGGYHVEETTNNVNKIPVLGSLPFVGNIFSYSSSTHAKRERIFIIAPRVSPTFHRPESYSYFGNDEEISRSINKLNERWKLSNLHYSDVFIKKAQQFSMYGTINDFSFSETDYDYKIPFTCRQSHADFQFLGGKNFSGEGIRIYAGKVYNHSEALLQLNEKSCFGEGMIGVSYIDDRTLEFPNQSSRVLIAVEVAKIKH